MTIIYLPGFGTHNEDEWEAFYDAFQENEVSVIAHRWNHWDEEGAKWNKTYEVESILRKIETIQDKEYKIVAKSIGTFVSLDILEAIDEMIPKAILMGLPLQNWQEESEDSRLERYLDVLTNTNTDLTIIQNSKDPHGSFEFIESALDGVEAEFIEQDAEDHSYGYINLVMNLVH